MNKSKIYMIVCIGLLFLSVIGSSVAYYREVLFDKNVSTITYGLDYYINYAKGQDISGVSLVPGSSYTDGNSSDIEFWKKDNTYDIYGHVYLDINEIGTNLSKTSGLKYTLVNNGQIISQGPLSGGKTGDSILVAANIPLQTTKQLYTIYIWLDANDNPDMSIEEEVLSVTVRCEATMKPIDAKVNLISHINSLYIANYDSSYDTTFADGSGMNYYAPNVRLMSDGLDSMGNMTNDPYKGNIRYYGADDSNLKNYIYFNCSDYSNQSSETCETWRIIGIVDGKVKLIRSSSLGNYSWDYTSTRECDNNWSDATLNTLLNSTYYNSGSTTYYNGVATGETVSFASNGITVATRNANLISESTWYTNGMSDSNIYANASYEGERTGTSTYPSNIGLAYPSDYGYSADLNTCTNTILNYDAEECTNGNWLTTTFTTDDWYWLITPNSDDPDDAWLVDSGYVYGDNYLVAEPLGVVPVLYLNTELTISSDGDGSSGNPYQLYVEPKPPTLIEHITNLYSSGTPTLITQESSGDSYYYSYQDDTSTWGLMNDGLKVDNTLDATTTGLATTVTDTTALTTGTEGNIRYFGPSDSVNNYIYFNCDDYSNQSDSTCELWRIIGIVDGKVKIIRNDSIGNLAWDQDKNQDSTKTTYNNNWTTSSLQEFLNGLYYNRGTIESHPYYSDSTGTTTTTLNLKTIGITEATRNNNLILESTWYLGGYSTPSGLYPNEIYNYERQNKVGTTIYSTNDFIINKNIGLMYASDYGYGTDLTKCSKDIYNYNTVSACTTGNWLFNSSNQWLTTPHSSDSTSAWRVRSSGRVYSGDRVYLSNFGVRPVLYLDSELGMESGHEGTSIDPYRISIS